MVKKLTTLSETKVEKEPKEKVSFFTRIKRLISKIRSFCKKLTVNPFVFVKRVLDAGIMIPSFKMRFSFVALIVGFRPLTKTLKVFLTSWFAESLTYMFMGGAVITAIIKSRQINKAREEIKANGGYLFV